MRWLIYGDILTRHVVDSCVDTLKEKGCDVIHIPSVKRSHRFIDDQNISKQVKDNLEHVLSHDRYDALLNFRVSELGKEHLEFIRSKGVTTFAWLPDDPLLYNLCYRHIVDHYDFILHCGYVDVISYYQQHHKNINGFNFPFWTSNKYFPRLYNVERCEYDLGFLGNCHTTNRRGRYELLSSIPFKTVIFGKLAPYLIDTHNISGGYINDPSLIPERISKFKIGINIPQIFYDSKGTEYDYPDLVQFDSFYFPSRIVHYAACGIPIITKQTRNVETIMPSILVFSDKNDLIEKVDYLINNQIELTKLSELVYSDYRNYLNVRARIEMLFYIINSNRSFNVEERANLWKTFPEKRPY